MDTATTVVVAILVGLDVVIFAAMSLVNLIAPHSVK